MNATGVSPVSGLKSRYEKKSEEGVPDHYSVFLYLFHLPFAVARSAANTSLFLHPVDSVKEIHNSSLSFIPTARALYDSLHLSMSGLSRQAFETAKKGFDRLVEQGRIMNDSILAIADFSQPSSRERLYILDLKKHKLLFQTLVAHGRNSGLAQANVFSNRPSSYMSSPGFYVTRNAYEGNNGYSLKLEGLERGINDNAYERALVIHGAPYVSQDFIRTRGFIGRSEGCPAVPLTEAMPIINTIKGGACLFIYSPNRSYLSHSDVLN
ncbi:MAG: murein L,D-transpeptidase catalytic domain family protein [Chitinophagales bacterium]